MKKKFTTIRSRITLTTITLCIFLSIAVPYISYSFYYKSVKQNMIRTAESSLTLLGSSIDSNIQDAYSFVRNCQANSFILNYLSSQGSQSARITASTYQAHFYCLLQEPGFYPGSCFHQQPALPLGRRYPGSLFF